MEIVDIIDGDALTKNCALGLPACSDVNPCPFHSRWKGIRNTITTALRNGTLLRMAQDNLPAAAKHKSTAAKPRRFSRGSS